MKRATRKPRNRNPIVEWGKKIDWGRRIKAVCKPCWELKYCPYGPLVEQFPLESERGERSCRIFGHNCPVFYVAEPLTETKELRNISRTIPRVTQFRVMKRENQICCVCKQAVFDPDIEFDHIIPWSKGGSSDEANVRLLCRKCNRKRRADFEDEYLVDGLHERLSEPAGVELIKWFLFVVGFGRWFENKENRLPTGEDYGQEFNNGKTEGPEEMAASQFALVRAFFVNARPKDLSSALFKALAFRWGGIDAEIHSLRDVAREKNVDMPQLLEAERDFMRHLGELMKTDGKTMKAWAKL